MKCYVGVFHRFKIKIKYERGMQTHIFNVTSSSIINKVQRYIHISPKKKFSCNSYVLNSQYKELVWFPYVVPSNSTELPLKKINRTIIGTDILLFRFVCNRFGEQMKWEETRNYVQRSKVDKIYHKRKWGSKYLIWIWIEI